VASLGLWVVVILLLDPVCACCVLRPSKVASNRFYKPSSTLLFSKFECDLGTTFVMNPGQASLDISIQNTEAILGDILENGKTRDIWAESRYHLPPLSLSV